MFQFRKANCDDIPRIMDLLRQLNPEDEILDLEAMQRTCKDIQRFPAMGKLRLTAGFEFTVAL
ncbi:MAG TPA: hypothetical protein VLM37_06065 [Fibrobacteraceae bacterium]|nr:hypothetical protein [Fibrobacteraceae bacterium]